jgi:Flp pilus assembly CpaF family ATPase
MISFEPPETEPLSDYARQLATTQAISRVNFDVALGPLKAILDDPTTQDISVNPDGHIWVSRGGQAKVRAPEIMPSAARQTLIGMLANRQARTVDRLHSRLEADLPYYDVRVQGFAPPIADWPICLRCHSTNVRPLRSNPTMFAKTAVITDHATTEAAPEGYLGALEAAIARGDNIAIVGRPGAGKTTLLNSVLHESARLRPTARLVTVEDRHELRASHADALQLYARVEQAKHDGTRFEYGFVDILSDVLRTSLDVLAFGELRDGESALALLMALNCGTSGFAFTLHANSAFDALSRLEDLIRLAKAPVIRRTIARFVNTIVYLEMDENRNRSIAGMVRVLGVDENDEYIVNRIAT